MCMHVSYPEFFYRASNWNCRDYYKVLILINIPTDDNTKIDY
jgi:hypothetical protein